ncbi:chaperone modulatory protein CbpM [Primorskyibacter sedentarius]|uniref:Chaperone modulatory protein CbpM n=1 Tax=Primorskyibacter sedentarius TaxID=745311 RepID=A0A4R3J3W4_9RHOB|nr:chaperone modulator CbpM [Primorskyibacter sedentarius]TCS59895.1 chaperone modulatory protein CbpM [Primorskyibacter sedentarius]
MRVKEHDVVEHVERVSLRELRLWVRQGWVRPSSSTKGPVFDELDLARIELLCDLRKELSLPSDTVPVVLNLLDHLHQARRDLRALAEALAEQPEEVQRSVAETVQNRKAEMDVPQTGRAR